MSIFWKSRFACWVIIASSSIAVTLNYLRPDINIYSNAGHHIIALRGLEKKGTLSLINPLSPKTSLNGEDFYQGFLSVSSSNGILLREKLTSHPLYAFDQTISKQGAYKLINGTNLLKFTNNIRFTANGHFVELSLKNDEKTLIAKAKFQTDSIRTVDLAFDKQINKGYPLVDILRSGGNCSSTEEDLLSYIKDANVVREILSSDYVKENKWYITIPPELYSAITTKRIKIEADNQPITYSATEKVHSLKQDQPIYWGIGSNKSRAISFRKLSGERISMNFDMPIMYNFPSDTLGSCNKIAAISSSSEDLLSSEIKEAFFFDLFSQKDNEFHFNGTVSYQTAESPAPLRVNIIDANQDKNKKVIASTSINTNNANHFQLSTKDKHVKWNVSIVNLREVSPITEKSNPFINEWLIIGTILISLLFAISTMVIFSEDGKATYKAISVFNIWNFFIPMITLRLYLLWRIAVFPPTIDITKDEFLRYRMENAISQNAMVITLACIMILMLSTIGLCVYERVLKPKSIVLKITPKYALYLYISLLCGASILVIFRNSLGTVFGNIMIPVIVFFLNEYICLKFLKLPYRIVNVLLILILLVIADPGYAIMFIIFSSVYYIIQTIVFRNSESTDRAERNAAWKFCLFLSIFVGIIIIFAPQIVAELFGNKNIFGIPVSSLLLALFAILISVVVIKVLNIYYGKRVSKIASVCAIILIPVIGIFGPSQLNKNKHIKYRSLIHTQDVSQIMMNEDVAKRDNQRLLEASQNQWFLQYHSNLGKNRIFDDGILHLYPHFKKGVSWSTQISDVICSRYIIAELSLLVPLAMILFAIVFFLFALKHLTESPIGKSLSYGIALLFLIQTTFVWMANTNRMIFFGQDYPFMSQNARVTMFMFCFLLFLMMCTSGRNEEDESTVDSRMSINGFEYFNRRPIKLFMVLFFAIFGVVFTFGNKYSTLYKTEQATTFNAGEAMMQAEKDIDKINAYLSSYEAKRKLKSNGENLSKLFNEINNTIGLDNYVEMLTDNGEIQPFSASLYKAFRNNLQTDNRIDNIIHLQYISSANSYKFALNNGFYSLRAPEMQKKLWSGNIYAYDDKNDMKGLLVPSSDADKIDIYRIPRSWLKDRTLDIGIADVRYTSADCEMVLKSPLCDYKIENAKVFIINIDECIESKIGNSIYLTQLSGRKEKLMAKNMIVNGQNKFFYPMGKSLFWIKDFSELLASQTHSNKNKNCEITLDKDLLENVYNVLEDTKKTCSVVALDGKGNVRLMAEYNSRDEYNLDPNNSVAIERIVEESYLNPNYSEDSKTFGNQNLVYMLPGPGSSLKPITYAAVSSQTSDVDWASLKLHAPNQKFISSGSKYYLMKEFGPDYKYSDKAPFKSISGDERGIDGWVDNAFYLYKSSNYYNALITYFGNYDKGELRKISNIIEPTSDFSSYPVFQINGKTYRFKNSPNKERQNSVLNTALALNFKMNVSLDSRDSVRFISPEWISSTNVLNYPWVFPSQSNAYIQQMKELESEALRLKQYSLGASPLRITPLMMAEMYGRLYSLHPDYYACITKNNHSPIEDWDVPQGKDQNYMFNFYKNQLYYGMKLCASNPSGTAYGYLSNVDTKDGKYSLYAKTGTLTLGEKIKDDKMLAVIITNKDLALANNPEDYRFYVLYFRFKQTGGMYNISKIINQVIESKSFISYMNS